MLESLSTSLSGTDSTFLDLVVSLTTTMSDADVETVEPDSGALVLVGADDVAVLLLLVLTVVVVLTTVLVRSTATGLSEADWRSWCISTRMISSFASVRALVAGAPRADVQRKSVQTRQS